MREIDYNPSKRRKLLRRAQSRLREDSEGQNSLNFADGEAFEQPGCSGQGPPIDHAGYVGKCANGAPGFADNEIFEQPGCSGQGPPIDHAGYVGKCANSAPGFGCSGEGPSIDHVEAAGEGCNGSELTDSTVSANEEDVENFEQPPLLEAQNPVLDPELQFAQIVVEEGLTTKSTNKLLEFMRNNGFKNFPKTRETLVHTPRQLQEFRPVHPGRYLHLGIQNALLEFPENSPIKDLSKISLAVNIDGLPVFGQKLWPILGALPDQKALSPLLIGVYEGPSEPKNRDEFLEDFIAECIKLINQGVYVTKNHIHKEFEIEFVCCDTPGRAMVTGTQGHNGKHSCPKCDQNGGGEHLNRRMVFTTTPGNLRSNESFRLRLDPRHHSSPFPTGLERIPRLDMVQQIVLDPMHLVDLGVTKKILQLLYTGHCASLKLRSEGLTQLNSFYSNFSKYVPSDFARPPRSLDELPHWKATEFRFFNLYGGLLTFHAFFSVLFEHFLLFFCALRLLSKSEVGADDISTAKGLLDDFVSQFPQLYGEDKVSFNVHGLLHLSDCAQNFGPLNSFSAYKFENFMQELKRPIHKKHQFLEQLVKRNAEQSYIAHKLPPQPEFSRVSHEYKLKRPLLGCSFAYRTSNFSNFKITGNERDGCCLLACGTCISVECFTTQNDIVGVIGKRYLDPRPFFTSPINSIDVGVRIVQSLSEEWEFFPLEAIVQKLVRVPYHSSFVLIELLHVWDR